MKSAILLTFICFAASAQTFKQEDVSFANGDIQLHGTLSFPSQQSAKHKAIIFVSGSGPQNRDSEIFGFKPFKILADFFNGQGFAVLRYDDRGTGASTGKSVNESTTAELADDTRRAFQYLSSRTDIDPARIALLGHSEGGVVVPIVASQHPVSFIILMAGFGVPGVELSNAQQAAILRASGMSEEFISASGTMNREVMKMMADPAINDDALRAFVKEGTLKLLPLLPEQVQSQITDKDKYAELSAQQALMQSKSVWVRHYMSYDPLPTLKKVKCPALMLFGELDTQVLASQNAVLMRDAMHGAGNHRIQTTTISKANHLFQEAITGSPAEYTQLKKEFVPELFDVLKLWIADF